MANPTGGFIWYELMSPDPAAAKRFYDAVVGWAIATDPVAPEEPMETPGGEYALNGTNSEGAMFGLVGPRKT